MTTIVLLLDVPECVHEFLHEHPDEPWCWVCIVRELHERDDAHSLPEKRDVSREVSVVIRTLTHCMEFEKPPEPCGACGKRREQRIRFRSRVRPALNNEGLGPRLQGRKIR